MSRVDMMDHTSLLADPNNAYELTRLLENPEPSRLRDASWNPLGTNDLALNKARQTGSAEPHEEVLILVYYNTRAPAHRNCFCYQKTKPRDIVKIPRPIWSLSLRKIYINDIKSIETPASLTNPNNLYELTRLLENPTAIDSQRRLVESADHKGSCPQRPRCLHRPLKKKSQYLLTGTPHPARIQYCFLPAAESRATSNC